MGSSRINTARQRLADIFDVIEGGDRIKRTEFDEQGESTELMHPEDFLDKTQSMNPDFWRGLHYRKRPWNTGPKTNLGDVHSNFLSEDPKTKDISNFQWGEDHHGQNLEEFKEREIFRGDELGDVEFYKRKIRRGDPIETPELHHRFNFVDEHEGRHRARALLEEGVEEMPVKGIDVIGDSYEQGEFKGLNYLEGQPTSVEKEKPKFMPKYKSPIGLGKSARIQMARERLKYVRRT
jgi:hypothetical protein